MAHIFTVRTGKPTDNYLDDFFFVALKKLLCDGLVQEFLELCKIINFPVSLDKTHLGVQVLVFLGILINTVSRTIWIPVEKRDRAINLLLEVINSKKTRVLHMQQITGLLNFILKAVVPGRAFTRCMYCKFSDPKLKQHYHIKVDEELKSDCTKWLKFLTEEGAVWRSFMDMKNTLQADKINFYTDASGAKN